MSGAYDQRFARDAMGLPDNDPQPRPPKLALSLDGATFDLSDPPRRRVRIKTPAEKAEFAARFEKILQDVEEAGRQFRAQRAKGAKSC